MTNDMSHHDLTNDASPESRVAAEVVRSEERLQVGTRSEVVGRVRIAKRVVTEERTVTVTVRREELVVEEVPVDPSGAPGGLLTEHPGPGSSGTRTSPSVEIVLSEEEVEVTTHVVPRERVRVYVDTVTELVEVDESVAREVVELDDGRQ